MAAQSTAASPPARDARVDSADALLIIGHGTRDPLGLAEFHLLVERVTQQKTAWSVSGCFLELADPSIAAAVDRLAARGCSRIRALPLMLFSAGHAKRDIPAALAEAIARNPGIEVELCPALGCHPAIIKLSSARCQAALAGRPAISPADTLLILVGRGSSDTEALSHMQHLADLRRAASPESDQVGGQCARVAVAYVAVATPSLATVLERAAQSDFRRVIVQPHLLFAGSVLAEVHRLVEMRQLAETGRQGARREWIVTEALGPDPRLVTAVVDIASSITPSGLGLEREPNTLGLRLKGRA